MKRFFLFSLILFLYFAIPSPVSASQFSDVQGHWAEGYIYNAQTAGLIIGYPDGTFQPDKTISRAEFITILAKESGESIDESTITAQEFPDVPKDHWARLYILWGRENDILSGYEDGTFRPDRIVSRQEMASLLYRYIKNYHHKELIVNTAAITFVDDNQIGTWAKEAVYAMQRSGIITGKGNLIFDPQSGATRAETTVMMSKYLQYYRYSETSVSKANLYFNGELKATSITALTNNNSVMIPARSILEAAGYRVTYYPLPQLVVADRIDSDIAFWLGSTTYYRNGIIGQLKTAPIMSYGSVYIPLSELSFCTTISISPSAEPDTVDINIGDTSSPILRNANNFSGSANSTANVIGSVFLGSNGKGFLGTINAGKMSYGSYTTDDGDLLVGNWKNGVLEGAGRSISSSGEYFVGTFQNGTKLTGTTYYTDGSRFIGTWTKASSGAVYPLTGKYIAPNGTTYGSDNSSWSGGALSKSKW